MSDGQATGDYEALIASVEEEARRIRESDRWTPDLQRELDALFEHLAPESEHDQSLHAVIDRAERAALIDLHAPVDDPRRGVARAKRAVRKLVLWYLDYVVRQFSAFAGTSVRGLRILADRITALEDRVQALSGSGADPVAEAGGADLDEEWLGLAATALGESGGRVLHVDAGEGGLVQRLRASGIDAYGADPRHADADLDIRRETAVEHLRAVGPGGLAGLALSGFVDRIPARSKALVAELAAEVLEPGGVVVLLASRPNRTVGAHEAALGDVVPGGPVQPAAWRGLLEANGFTSIEVHEGAGGALERVEGDAPGGDAVNRNFERIERALFPPGRYALVASLPRG